MRTPIPSRPTRLIGLLLVGPVFLLLLMLESWLCWKTAKTGIAGLIAEAFALKPIQAFGVTYFLRILLPIYFVGGLAAWITSLLPGLWVRRTWLRDWRGREAFGFGLSSLLWAHVVLWWMVPSTLWNLPGLRVLPFWLAFAILVLLSVAYPIHWLVTWQKVSFLKGGVALSAWLLAWSLMVLAPGWIPRPSPAQRPGNQPCQVLMLGVDGLRSDTFLAHAGELKGLRYRNAYTVIPATRLLWHILWGGDPMTFTIGHVGASLEEIRDVHGLKLIKAATDQGLKPRFYMDDGGTISLAGRTLDLDDALMPAAGWENFVNSNLAVGFPLYAVWENWFKPFPTTNPWAPLDAGLKEALRLGRGSGWVMFHSCLAHEPIYLKRNELFEAEPRWWTLRPITLQPRAHIAFVTQADVLGADPRLNAYRTYETRMNSILRSWEPIWNGLDQDPAYKAAARFLFSDHGERFHHVTADYQLQGVHGFTLDPWECRATMLAAGPGFSDEVRPQPREATLSLLSLVKGMARFLSGKGALDAAYLEAAEPVAPARYHTLGTDAFGPEPYKFRTEDEKQLATGTFIAPGGVWFTEYGKSAKERAKDASVAWAEGPMLHIFRPLMGGGAREFVYDEYRLVTDHPVDEATFQKAKAKVETLLSDPGLQP